MQSWPLLASGFQVTVTLYGLDGESELPPTCRTPVIPVFERGGSGCLLCFHPVSPGGAGGACDYGMTT